MYKAPLNLCNSKLLRNFSSNDSSFFKKKKQTIIITYSNKGFLLGLFVKNKKFLFLLPQKSSFHSYLFQRNACNFAVLCKPQLAVHKVFWKTVPNVLQTHLVANFQQTEKTPFLKESLGIKSLQFYWEMLIEIILPTVNKTFFFLLVVGLCSFTGTEQGICGSWAIWFPSVFP